MSKTGTKHDVEPLAGNRHGNKVLLFTIRTMISMEIGMYMHLLYVHTNLIHLIMSITTVSILYINSITSGVEIASHAGHCPINLVNVR